jgi:hypothetical protein
MVTEVTRTNATCVKYVDNTANGLALQIDRKVFLLDGTLRPVRDISMWDKKIIELGDPSDVKDAANKSYVDRWFRGVRTFVTVCEATKGPLSDGKFEWGFGVSPRNSRMSGYVMLAPGSIHNITLSSLPRPIPRLRQPSK